MDKLKTFFGDWRNQSKYFKWLLFYAKPFIPQISLMMLLNASVTFIAIWMALLSKQVIDSATSGGIVKTALFLYVLILFGNIVIGTVASLMSTMVNEKFSFGIRKQLYEKIMHSHWMDIQKYHTGDLMTRMTSDAGSIADGIVNVIPGIVMLFIELIATFFTLFYYSRMLAVFALLIAPIAGICCVWLGRKLKKLQIKVQESESAYRSFIQESLANLLVVKAFTNEEYATEKLTKLRDERFYWVFKKTKMGLASSTIMSLAFSIGYIVAFTYGAFQVSENVITYGTMTVFLTLINRVQSPVYQLAQNVPRVVSILASAGRVMELQEIPSEECLEEHIDARNVGVKVDGLTFGYTKENVLEEASTEIRAGEFVAIVGESGIGKTTLVRLIMSFMSDAQGLIQFENENGEAEIANAGTREFISYVPQGNTLFSGTIRENIRMGKLDATEEEMIEALKMAAGYDFVMELPNGIDTVIGERGHGISEGQAQRIAIARALVRQAPFLILDEATSSLDEATELAVLRGIQNLKPRPTCLLITHRRSVLQYCDREIKIEDKKIQEQKM